MLSALGIDVGFFAPPAGENSLIYSSGLAAGWTPIDSDSRLVTIDQQRNRVGIVAAEFTTRHELTLGEVALTFNDAWVLALTGYDSDIDSRLTRNVMSYDAWGGALDSSARSVDETLTPTTTPDAQNQQLQQPAEPIGVVDRGVEYGFALPIADPVAAIDDPVEAGMSASDLAGDSTPVLVPPPVTSARQLERIVMTTGVEPAVSREGLIDLSALLIARPERTPTAPATDHRLAASDAPARDAVFAVESWVRALPHAAATPPPSAGADFEERSAMSEPIGPVEIAPLSIDPTASHEPSEASPRVSAIESETLPNKPRLDEVGQATAPKPLERSSTHRFLATVVSVLTVGGLVRAVRDEPVRSPLPREHSEQP